MYSATITNSSRELSKIERIALKDTRDAVKLDTIAAEKPVIDVVAWVVLDIHNDKSSQSTDYKNYMIIDSSGTKYVTGSDSFWNAFYDIAFEMGDEPFSIKVYSMPSKNYKGKNFLSCSLAI